MDRRYGLIDADCCCNQRLVLIKLPLSSIADADTVAAVLADAVVAASYQYGLILRVVYRRCCRVDQSFQSASTDQTPQSHCCCNQRQLIKLLSSVANVVGTTAVGADCSIVVVAVLSIRNYDESANRRIGESANRSIVVA